MNLTFKVESSFHLIFSGFMFSYSQYYVARVNVYCLAFPLCIQLSSLYLPQPATQASSRPTLALSSTKLKHQVECIYFNVLLFNGPITMRNSC